MAFADLIPVLITSVAGLAGGAIANTIARPKVKAETEGLIATTYKDLLKEVREERLEYQKQIKELKTENQECEYNSEVILLELDELKQIVIYKGWNDVQAVYILDDNKLVTTEFKLRFDKISLLEAHVYNDAELFLKDVQKNRPPMLILDYMLGDIVADDVIEHLGYKPEIIIMSADKSVQRKYNDIGVRFFHKDEHYVIRIAKAVVEHLHNNISKQ